MKKNIIICIYLLGLNISLMASSTCNDCEKIAKRLTYFAEMISKPNFHQPKRIFKYWEKIMINGKYDSCSKNDTIFDHLLHNKEDSVYRRLFFGLKPYYTHDSIRVQNHLNKFLVVYTFLYFMKGEFGSKLHAAAQSVVFSCPTCFEEFMRFKTKKERAVIYDYIYQWNRDNYTGVEEYMIRGYSHSELFERLKDYKHLKEMKDFYARKQQE